MTLNENEQVPKEEISGLVDCPHVTNSIRKNKINELFKRIGNFHFDKCDDCNPNEKFVEVTAEYMYDFSCWLCLFCGKNLCGRNMNRHAVMHYENDSHKLSLSISVGSVWCYACDAYVDISNHQEIKVIINALEDHKTKSSSDSTSSSTLLLHSNLNHFVDLPDHYPIRGLINLGNTCYMNSVLQCLSKTPYLRKVLEDLKENSYEFQINLNKLKPMKNFDHQKTTIKGTLSPICDDVTLQLLETISELNYSRSGIRNCYDPHFLLRNIAQIVHQFAGYQQHDSHELMRHLLEIVRTGDMDRAKLAIVRSVKSEAALIDPKQLKGIAQQLLSQIITTETVFKGFLVSTLQCEQCKHKTQREECFLDLSLPIYTYSVNKMDDSYNQNSVGGPFNNYYHSNQNASHSHTHQQHFYHQQQSQNSQGLSNHNSNIMADSSGKYRKKRSKKMEKKRNKENRNRATLSSSSSRIELDKTNIKIVSDENKIDKKLCIEGDDVSSTTHLGEEDMLGVDVSLNYNEAENCLHDEVNTNEEELEEDDDDDEEKSLSTNTDLCMEIHSTSDDLNSNTQDKNHPHYSYNINNDAMEVEFLDDTQRKCPISFENDQQCSVTTCLFRFTEAEVMGGNNKVGCEKCTKNNGKLIYQKTKKQLLISKPPPVLILHLKRFEAHMGSYRKTMKAVNFSTILDLTPFCWKDCRTIAEGNQYLYSLYGIVEHSGTLRSGHYVAYVKVRPFYENLDFIQPLLTKSKSIGDLTAELLTSNMLSSSLPNPNHTYNSDNSSTYWFRISDSSCTRVSEKDVLAAQAYLLFYERIA